MASCSAVWSRKLLHQQAVMVLLAVLFGISSASYFSRFAQNWQDGTCAGKCDTLGTNTGWPCQCNKPCTQFGDCCPDYQDSCLSCLDRCDVGFNADFPCQCNSRCSEFGNCCDDFEANCDGGTVPGAVTDADLEQLSEALLAADVNNLGSISYDLQGSTSGSDVASGPLFLEPIPAEYFTRPTIAALMNLLDNYNPFVTDAEDYGPEQEAEIATFLDEVFNTEVFSLLIDFAVSKGIVSSEAELWDKLREIWFTPYCRSAKRKGIKKNKNRQCAAGSSGFEHVFIGEQKSNSISGVHGWISFALAEQEGRINYFGHMTTVELGDKGAPIELSFTWDGLKKPISSIFIGASPEFELASLSICFLTRPDSLCPVSLAGQKVKIQTYRQPFNGLQLIGSAYFDVSN